MMQQPWFMGDIGVAFNTGDVNFGGAHDMTVLANPNTLVTALLPGTIETVTFPSWGVSVGIKLDTPFNNILYMAYLHLSAAKVKAGDHVSTGDVIGWSGGCNDASQYDGTSNPTGQNFLNTPDMSSQPQVGIALMNGPEYGVGAGWTTLPDSTLNPTMLYYRAVAAYATWLAGFATSWGTGIANDWFRKYLYGQLMPPPLTVERSGFNWSGTHIKVQEFGPLRCEWDGKPHWYRY